MSLTGAAVSHRGHPPWPTWAALAADKEFRIVRKFPVPWESRYNRCAQAADGGKWKGLKGSLEHVFMKGNADLVVGFYEKKKVKLSCRINEIKDLSQPDCSYQRDANIFNTSHIFLLN